MKNKLLVFLLFWGTVSAYSQSTQTPFSSKGLGEIIYPGTINNLGMGGISIAYPSSYCYNLLNPAMLAINNYTTFDMGAAGETRNISNGSLSQNNTSGDLSFVSLGFPVKRGFWSSGFSLNPYSYLNYNISSREMINNSTDTAVVYYKGTGGINNLSWSNGFLFFKSLAIGAKVSYLFGSNISESVVNIPNKTAYTAALYDQNTVHDINLGLGIDYRLNLSTNYTIHLGGIYETPNTLNIKHTERLERRDVSSGQVKYADSLITNEKGSSYLPERFGAGVSLVRNGKWVFGLEYLAQNWSKYKNFYNSNDGLIDSRRYATGIEFIPNSASLTNYFARVIYRAGVYYNQQQFQVDLNQVNEFGINFGVSLPVSRPSLVNLALQFGSRSSNGKIAINENFIRISLGLTYNDIWFIRRRID